MAVPTYLAWLRVDPAAPNTLLLMGFWDCPGERGEDGVYGSGGHCAPWLLRSADGGATWTDLRPALSRLATFVPSPAFFEDPSQGFGFFPAIFAPDGHAYLSVVDSATPSSQKLSLLWSADGGAHWQAAAPELSLSCDFGLTQAVLSPAPGARLYALYLGSYGTYCGVEYSTDDGQTWHIGGAWVGPVGTYARAWGAVVRRLGIFSPSSLVPDPRRPATLYGNLDTLTGPNNVARSEDAGLHWSVVVSPTVAPPLHTFKVGLDPHERGLLVGYPGGAGVPRDRIYLSANEGRTWRAATCPGVLHGACPAFTVDNVFGAGASYAFVGNGVYRFQGGGPAEVRLALSAHLPFRTADLIDVSAGARAGDPIYVLTAGRRGNLHGRMWRSTDGGQNWRELLRGPFPIHKLRR